MPLGCSLRSPGCGEEYGESRPALQPVKGQVLLDGKPLTAGEVVLVSPKYASEHSGDIGSDGRFTIKTGDAEGAPEGDYRVRIDPEPKQGRKRPAEARSGDASLSRPIRR